MGAHLDDDIAYTRGQNPRSAMAYAVDRGGRDALARVLARLSDDDCRALGAGEGSKPVGMDDWIPFALQARLLRAIDDELGQGDLTSLHAVGRFMSARDIPRLFRPFLRAGKTGWIVSFATRVWRMYHSHGTWEVDRSRGRVLATLVDHPAADEAFCATFLGWVDGALQLSGAIDVVGEHPACAARGAPHCVFVCTWRTRAHTEPTVVVRSRSSSTSGSRAR